MKKITVVLLLLSIIACSDGDLQIENIDFDGGTVTFCPLQFNQTDIQRTLFFKIVEDEALILQLQSGLIASETASDTATSSLENQSTLTYRLFSENVANTYFCSDIPPATPTILEETTASSGVLSLISSVDTVTSSTKTYVHDISITDLTLLGNNGERITDQPGLDFGTYATTVDSSVDLVFSNYNSSVIASCGNEGANVQFFKVANDEAIGLEFPSSILVNEVTIEPRTVALGNMVNDTTATFTNRVYRKIVTDETVCTLTTDDPDLVNSFTTVSGMLSITTVQGADSTPENPSFDHTFTLSSFIVQDANENNAPEIETYVFGTITTRTN
ncbi:hypothetical protein FGF1_34710 [Flavobacteriaceae bacterium GF1]